MKITDYVLRGDGITVSFSDGEVCDIVYRFNPVAQRMGVIGCPPGVKTQLLLELVNGKLSENVAKVDGRFAKVPVTIQRVFASVAGGASVTVQESFENLTQVSELTDEFNNFNTPVGTIDPTGVSSTPANLIDNSTFNSVNNDLSSGSTNKEMPAIDYGTPVTIETIRLFWRSAPLTPTSFDLQISNDGTSWTNTGGFNRNIYKCSRTAEYYLTFTGKC